MAAVATERFGSRRKTGAQSFEFLYFVRGHTDEDDARAAIETAAPATYNGLISQGLTDFEVIGPDLCFGTVSYGVLELGFDASTTQFFEFDTTGGTQHVTHSKETVNWYSPAGADQTDTPDHKNAIGVDSEGKNPAGADIVAGQFNFTVKRRIDVTDIDSAYIAAIYRLSTGKYNTATFSITLDSGITLSFAAGEALFLGARGGPVSQTQWEITFAFSGSPNVSGSGNEIAIGDISVTTKLGWNYLWVQFGPEEDTGANALASRPRYAYVERVYDPDDFDDLEVS